MTCITLGNPPTVQTFVNIVCWLTGTSSFLLLGLTFVCGSHMLWETGTAWSLSCLHSEMSNNNKIIMLLSERGFSMFRCTARQLWRGSTFIKHRCLQLGGSWEPCTQAFGDGQHVCIHQPAWKNQGSSIWLKIKQAPTSSHLNPHPQKKKGRLRQGGEGSIWHLPKECNNPKCGVRALHDRTLALAPGGCCQFPSHACSVSEVMWVWMLDS